MNKLNVVIMGQNCEKQLPLCLKAIEDADNIIYLDGGSKDFTQVVFYNCLDAMKNPDKLKFLYNEFNQDDKDMNGKQRNFYLNYLKEHHMGEWALCIDVDEVVEDLSKIKEFINEVKDGDDYIMSVKMRHFIHDLGHEDATRPIHFCPNRLFKITEDLFYPLGEHVVLQSTNPERRYGAFNATTIWHLSAFDTIYEIKKRYDRNMKFSNVHNKDFLDTWLASHLTGTYPTTSVKPEEVPNVIFKHFGIDKDRFYFANRGLELKHILMANQWAKYFDDDDKIFEVIEFGCGRAPFGYGFEMLEEHTYTGVELSQWAVDHSFVHTFQGNILDYDAMNKFKLVIAFDVLEHLKYEDLNKAIDNLIKHMLDNGYILVSVPVLGDPNLEADSTHIIKEKQYWWIEQFTKKGLKQIPTPDKFLFKEQILIFTK